MNSSYVIQQYDTFLSISNMVYEGLTTCLALQEQNKNSTAELLYPGMKINVPIRCACPTKNQSENGIKYLMSYVIKSGQYVSLISEMFGVDIDSTFKANGLSAEDYTIYPNTTLLIPLQKQVSSSQIIQSPPPPPEVSTPPPPGVKPSGGSSKAWIFAVVGVVAGLAFATISLVLVYFLCIKKRKKESVAVSMVETPSFESIEKPSMNENLDSELSHSQSFWGDVSNIAKSVNVYSYKELQRATENFSPGFWIKKSVYRGVINGDLAAIKEKTGDVSEEINLLNKINHFNLVRLSGVCFHEGHWYLVYEYAANGVLSDWIHSQEMNDAKVLTWKQRVQVALDVATGLNYLHSYTSPPLVHKDLTSNHVFLDTDFRAKIGNIGLARRTDGEDEDFALTRHIVGTKGYMAPEYLENGLVSPKLDVYAFGMLLMEILTGKEVSDMEKIQLPLVESKDGEENLDTFMDPSLKGDYSSDIAILVIKLVHSCLQKDAFARPGMHEIVQTLSTIMNAMLSMEYKTSISISMTR